MQINHLSAIAAGVAYWIFQAIWYIALAGPWAAAAGVTPGHALPASSYVISFIVALVVGHVVEVALHDTENTNPPVHGVQFGIFFGIGIWLINLYVTHLFEGRPIALTLIDGFAVVFGLAIAGLVVGFFHRANAPAS